ncbi:3-methyl-2-oxobutanoate dehydrogenase subunit beta [Thermoplasma sp.]|uniref:3-methyl-2-oxobutanoate dehydrogenase subunit beta n=1 Tax=Thermoplasma sp. TaxID=1973142 RepID=UPI00127C7E4D|nr:3-methyl-2-oxobutanoate dehydrogenase subunit beta [Thermoplasma sp.]KAA8923519.1 MAG: 3-methyl-2-oxobutanoate dehydrogenase subunit beta [Thermoplasma sp.]
MPTSIPKQELMAPGHTACHGCGATLAMRYVLKALGEKTVVSVPASCWAVIPGAMPFRTLDVPMVYTPFAATGASISGLREGLDIQGKTDYNVVGFAGDGGTADIGLQGLSGAMERGHNVFYIMYDNEGYMNTGVQRSGSTPYGARTTTTPVGKERDFKKENKKIVADMMIAQNVPYVATATVAYPEDLIKKIEHAKAVNGPKFIQILAPCPTGWYYPPEKTIEISRLAVQSRMFPLYEFVEGRFYLNKSFKPVDVSEYVKAQDRFKHLNEDEIENLRRYVEERWNQLLEWEKLYSSPIKA